VYARVVYTTSPGGRPAADKTLTAAAACSLPAPPRSRFYRSYTFRGNVFPYERRRRFSRRSRESRAVRFRPEWWYVDIAICPRYSPIRGLAFRTAVGIRVYVFCFFFFTIRRIREKRPGVKSFGRCAYNSRRIRNRGHIYDARERRFLFFSFPEVWACLIL